MDDGEPGPMYVDEIRLRAILKNYRYRVEAYIPQDA